MLYNQRPRVEIHQLRRKDHHPSPVSFPLPPSPPPPLPLPSSLPETINFSYNDSSPLTKRISFYHRIFFICLIKSSCCCGVKVEKTISSQFKVGVHLKAVFTPPKIGQMEISFKQYKNPPFITQINDLGCFMNFLGDF